MPRLRSRWLFGIARDLRAFLNVHAGITRGPVPGLGTAAQNEKIEQLQRRLEDRRQKLKQVQQELAEERRRGAGAGVTGLEAEAARSYVVEHHGLEQGLPVVDLLDVLPNFGEAVSVYEPSGGGTSPLDVALLKGLAREARDCDYLEVGSWRGEGAANVAAVARECVAINPSGEEYGGTGFPEGVIAERVLGRDGAIDVAYNSFAFDADAFENHFDLACISEHRSREAVASVTSSVFGVLKDTGAVVWRGYRPGPAGIDWRVLAGILDGCPDGASGNLYHVSGTSCAVYLREAPAGRSVGVRRSSGRTFDVTLTARDVPRKLVVLDDAFPNLQSAFRIAEYNAYLERWKYATVYSTAQNRVSLREEKGFGQILDEYASVYPDLGSRVFRYGGGIDLRGDLAYFIFLSNANRFLGAIDEHDTPFAFTLYPGGGFKLDQQDSDEVLRRACSSPNFRKVIATQKVTRDYLIDRQFCDPEKIEFVYGGVFPLADLASRTPPKSYYKQDKDTLDVCFVAYKYTRRSIASKGYDVFVEVARKLSKAHDDVRFHVVGTFDESDVDVSDIRDRITFYGPRTSGFFPEFYSRMDVILSPNKAFALLPGAFDGFPTGSCMEAGLCGVAVLCSDPLDLNVAFESGEDMVIVPHDADAISATIDRYHDRPDELYRLARKGRDAFARVFGMQAQMEPRLRMLSELLGEQPNSGKPPGTPLGKPLWVPGGPA